MTTPTLTHEQIMIIRACSIVDLSGVDLSDLEFPADLLDEEGDLDGEKCDAALAAHNAEWVMVRREDLRYLVTTADITLAALATKDHSRIQVIGGEATMIYRATVHANEALEAK